MALETLNIDYIKDKDNKTVFPVTHSDAIIGGLSKKGYNINDKVYNNNWDNVINTGIYYSSAVASSTNRPQLIYGTTNIDVTHDFIEVVRVGSSAFQLAKISTGFKADHVVAYREFTNVTDTGAGSKGTWKSAYTASEITGSVLLTDVTTTNQTLKLSGITSYSDLDGRILIVYQESNANAKLPTKIKVNNLAYVPLNNLDGTAIEQDTFENKRVPILISYSSADSCFYLVGGGSGGAGHKILKSNKTVMPKEKNLMITGVSVHDTNITDVPADKLTKIKITAPDSSDESIKNIRKMTQAQYNALTTKDANTVYYITDGDDPIDMADYLPLKGNSPTEKLMTGPIWFKNNIGGIYGTMGGSDSYRIIGSDTGEDLGYLELATADNGNEPIYVRQYINSGKTFDSSKIARTLALLDERGNTKLPGNLILPGTAASSLQSTTKIIFGSQDLSKTYGVIRTNTDRNMIFSDSLTNNINAWASVMNGTNNNVSPASDNSGVSKIDLGTTLNRWETVYNKVSNISSKAVFSDKVTQQYNSNEECIEFVFN